MLAKAGVEVWQEVKAAHSQENYTNRINKLFFGYEGEANSISGLIAIPDNISTIGPRCFVDSAEVSLVYMPSIIYIGSSAFSGCSSISSVTLTNTKYIGNNAFYECTGITSLDLGIVERIGGNAFCGCTGLTELYYPDTLQELETVPNYLSYYSGVHDESLSFESYPFYNCTNVTSVSFGGITKLEPGMIPIYQNDVAIEIRGGVKEISEGAFRYKYCINDNPHNTNRNSMTITLMEGVQTIGANAFYAYDPEYSHITVNLPNSVTTIGDYAYAGTSLTREEINLAQFTSVGTGAFKDAIGIKTVVDGEGVTEIPQECFYGCPNITSVMLSSVTNIGDIAFYKCPELTSVELYAVKNIGTYAFCECTGITSLDLGIVERIGADAFRGCTGLTELYYPDTLQELETVQNNYYYYGNHPFESYPFYNCTNVTSVSFGGIKKLEIGMIPLYQDNMTIEIRGSVEEIAADAFRYIDCQAIENRNSSIVITLEEGVQTIGANAFSYSYAYSYDLYHMTVNLPNSVTTIGDYAYAGTSLTREEINLAQFTSVGTGAFKDAIGIKTVVDGEGVADVTQECFAGCLEITTLDLGSVKNVGENAFKGCENLNAVYVTSFNKLGYDLIGFPSSGITFHCYRESPTDLWATQNGFTIEYLRFNILNIPASTKTIESEAFLGLPNVDGIRLHDGVKSVATDAFDNGITLFIPTGSAWVEWAQVHGFLVVEE